MALIWFPCFVNDLMGSLSWRSMTPAQRGAYWQLICMQMQSEDGTLPDDVEVLGRLADLPLTGPDSIILQRFPVESEGRRANPRALAEWLKRQDISQKRSESGAIGAAKKQQMLSNCDSKPEANAKQADPTSTSTSTGTENSQKKKAPASGFLVAGAARSESDPDIQNAMLHYHRGGDKLFRGTVVHPETVEAIRIWRATPKAPAITDAEAQRMSCFVLPAESAENAGEIALKVAANEFTRASFGFAVAMRPKNAADILSGAYPPDTQEEKLKPGDVWLKRAMEEEAAEAAAKEAQGGERI